MLATLSPHKKGLRFGNPLRSTNEETGRRRPSQWYEGDHAVSRRDGSEFLGDEEVVLQVGKRLRERGEFCPPTIDYLTARGVIGFCWVTPKEIFAGPD